MRYGILADIHSNLEAFEAVLKALDLERCDQISTSAISSAMALTPRSAST